MNEQEIAQNIYKHLTKMKDKFYASGFKLDKHNWNIFDKEKLIEEARKLNINLIIKEDEIIASFSDISDLNQ